MSKIRIDPLSAIVRIYEKDIDSTLSIKEVKDSYYKTLVLTFSDDGSVRIQGAVNSPTLREMHEIKESIKHMGYSKLEWRHKDKRIVIDL